MKKPIALMAALLLAAGGAAAQQQTLSDAQIAGIVVTANEVDVEAGQLAKSMATNGDVKKFAQEMITDHTASNKSASDLAKKLNMKPDMTPSAKQMKANGDDNVKKLKKLSGAAFDKAYIDNEVTMHQTVLDTIDKTLMPNVKNAELKSLLTSTRPVIAAHLDMAKKIQGQLK